MIDEAGQDYTWRYIKNAECFYVPGCITTMKPPESIRDVAHFYV